MDWNAFIIPVVYVLVELVKKTRLDKEWLPFIAVAFGLILGAVYAVVFKVDLFTYIVEGFLYGAAAAGLYDVGQSGIKKITAGNEDLD